MDVPTLYNSFNARNLSAAQVAERFVISTEFKELCENNHTVLMGPRGSGKTTMLKMLTPEALALWRDSEADTIRASVGFTAIYIPSDVHWRDQVAHIGDSLQGFKQLTLRATQAAVATNVFSGVLEAFASALRIHSISDRGKEARLCEQLITEWQLPSSVPTFPDLQLSIASRMHKIVIDTKRASDHCGGDEGRALSELPEYLLLDYFHGANFACMAFEQLYDIPNTKKWALCFDEMELCPEWLQNRLFSELRSSAQRFLFKISTSPLPTVVSHTFATPRNDMAIVRLWRHGTYTMRRFAEALTISTLARRGMQDVSPSQLFGSSVIAELPENKDVMSTYARNSLTYETIRDEAKRDSTFADLLRRKGVNPEDPVTESRHILDTVLRKAKPMAFLRSALRKSGGVENAAKQGRKLVALYSGVEAIYDVSDGNPRWLIGIIEDLLRDWPLDRRGKERQIPQEVQARVLTRVSKMYSSLLTAYPIKPAMIGNTEFHLVKIMRKIKNYFQKNQIRGPFLLDPTGSFTVDSWMEDDMLRVLRDAAYYGVIVFVDPEANALDANLRGKRFRFSFLLSPDWHLPLRLYRSISLGECLGIHRRQGESKQDEEVKPERQDESDQNTLFGD